MLVLARPLHTDRAADRARDDRRIGGRVFMAVHAVAAGAVDIDEPHFFLGQPKEARESLAIAVCTLRGGPHRGRIAAHIGDRAGRANRSVALHRPEVTGAAADRATLRAWPWLSAINQHLVGGLRIGAQSGDQLVLRRKAGPLAPLRAQRAGGAHCHPFVIGNDGEKILDPHHTGASEILDRSFVDTDELGADGRRPDHARMHHPRHAEILHIGKAAGALGRHIGPRQGLADQGIGRGIFERRLGIEFKVEAASADQLGEPDPGATILDFNLAVLGNEIVGRRIETLRGEFDQRLARGRRGAP